MAKITNDKWVNGNTNGFAFSGVRPEHLSATEYTLVTLAIDKTGSVAGFESQIQQCVYTSIEACKKSPRAENLLIRIVEFNESVYEVIGFTPLMQFQQSMYPTPVVGGCTALFDALYSGVEASNQYAKTLSAQEFSVNALLIAITDGGDNASRTNTKMVRDAIESGVKQEYLESMVSILIGINSSSCSTLLADVKTKCNLSQYEDAGNVTDKMLAKLAGFISKSISSQSQALGSGGPSQTIAF